MLPPASGDDNVVTGHSAEHPCEVSALHGPLAGVGHLRLGDILKEDEITLLRSADANLEVPKWSDDVIHNALRHNNPMFHSMRVIHLKRRVQPLGRLPLAFEGGRVEFLGAAHSTRGFFERGFLGKFTRRAFSSRSNRG